MGAITAKAVGRYWATRQKHEKRAFAKDGIVCLPDRLLFINRKQIVASASLGLSLSSSSVTLCHEALDVQNQAIDNVLLASTIHEPDRRPT